MIEENRPKLRMKYVPTKLVDLDYILKHTIPSTEVRNTGLTYFNKPLNNQGRFGSTRETPYQD